MKQLFTLIVLAAVLLSATACAAGPNVLANSGTAEGEIDGFWQGLWHGFISPVTFLISLFNDNIGIYEVYNNGGWYNFGFMLGVSIILGGGGSQSHRTRKG